MDTMKDVLHSLGLSDKEVPVYLALLRLGTAPASVLAKQTGLPRSTVQFLCQQLQRKGVISMIQRKNIYLFSADDPRRLLSLLELQRRTLDRQQENLHRIIGELERLRHPDAAVPRVRFYEGEAGVEAAWQSVLEHMGRDEEIIGYVYPLDASRDAASPALDLFIRKRIAKNVRMRNIATQSAASSLLLSRDESSLRKTRLLQQQSRGSPAEIMVYGSNICLVTVEHGAIFATVIENQSIAELLRASFDDHWKRLER